LIICTDDISSDTSSTIVLAFERLLFIEPTEYISTIYADVYIRIRDEILLQIALKEISLDEAINQKLFKIYGDKEVWDIQLKALREILPNEHFTKPVEPIVEDIPNQIDEEEVKKEEEPPLPRRPPSPQLKFLADAYAKIMQEKP